MKKALLSCICLGLFALNSDATLYTFAPSPSNLNNLDHNQFYTWGLNWSVPSGESIVSAQISFSNIWDWRVEPDSLFIHLLDTAPLGVKSWTDNEGGGDFFASPTFAALKIAQIKIGEWNDPFGGDPKKAQNVTFVFNPSQLVALQGYLTTPGQTGWGTIGFGLDPDCHYYNNGVSFSVVTSRASVPEGGSTIALLTVAIATLGFWRRRIAA